MHKIWTGVIGAVSLATAGALTPLASAGAATTSSAHYYLALGDSLSQGYQPTGPNGQGLDTDQGYVDDIYSQQYANDPSLQVVKLGCPGETTTTMLHGGICPTYASQEEAAVRFLHLHGAQTSFVTLDIGANNVDDCVDGSAIDGPCLVAGEKALKRQLPQILARLQAADPGVAIYGMNYYDPFLAEYLAGEQAEAEASVQLTDQFNSEMDQIYAAYGVPVADVASAFQTNDSSDADGYTYDGNPIPDNVGAICGLTWMCAPSPQGPNIHANAEGYQAIAGTFLGLGLPD